jgi:hypothetical protein
LFKKAIQRICLVFIFVMFLIPMAEANFTPSAPEVYLTSPAPSYVKTYSGTSVMLTFDVKEPQFANHAEVNHIYYCLDGLPAIEVNNVQKHDNEQWFSGYCINYHADVALDNLASGNHSVTVYCQDSLGRNLSTTRTFTMSASSINEVTSSTVTNKGIILIAIASVLVIAVTAYISFVYYKRKKENDSPLGK